MRRKPGMVGAAPESGGGPSTIERGLLQGKNPIKSTPIGLDRVRAGWVDELVVCHNTPPSRCGLGRQSGGGS